MGYIVLLRQGQIRLKIKCAKFLYRIEKSRAGKRALRRFGLH